MNQTLSLSQLGWRPYFQQQLTLEELEWLTPVRISSHHRSQVTALGEQGELTLPLSAQGDPLTVGDWVLIDPQHRIQRRLNRQSRFQRRAPGSKLETQLIAANIDTVFVVCSLNHDFNLNRIERFLALANDANVQPVVVLTKADLCSEVQLHLAQVQQLDPLLMVEAINALAPDHLARLSSWCGQGQSVALLGSSGVGKSTIINGLLQHQGQQTGSIREQDSKGRHTTTRRSLHLMSQGGLLMDTPGMRELQISDCEQGVNDTFADLHSLARDCRFSDCQHQQEPGCAVQAAIAGGELPLRRLKSYQKLMREQALNGATLAQKRAKDKALGKYYQRVQSASRQQKKGY
ncbi:ribosome small subunit-dependent GTPase A [Ferrimonas sp. SCSIO 43195]|uniref:ribosome small subunit-dependent GTPase A n=1 Tax=Ferrimonas sp. SCSIO 43195 TaxID=2822844 RepID=UPI0020753770|nr:ribosome small subunit-dependent GTPase A [Ferrimonas sp. SCSIO 43195]USD39017.1 ribosome small subunit-dependent GTPase A [Ferrimonas sp. SCSIO 43195]